jgi:hypothetical protein
MILERCREIINEKYVEKRFPNNYFVPQVMVSKMMGNEAKGSNLVLTIIAHEDETAMDYRQSAIISIFDDLELVLEALHNRTT